jgi:hypothetical protein
MNWTMWSGVRSSIPRIAVVGALIAIPMAVVSLPADATPAFGGASNTLAPYGIHPVPPAAPTTDAPDPPAPAPMPAPAPADYDWWSYGQGDGGAGGGGGGG